jgi:hypothetical protein
VNTQRTGRNKQSVLTWEVVGSAVATTAYLATQADWMSFEVKQHDSARRLWMIGLDVARNSENLRCRDLEQLGSCHVALSRTDQIGGHPRHARLTLPGLPSMGDQRGGRQRHIPSMVAS